MRTKQPFAGVTKPPEGVNCPSCKKSISDDFKICPYCGHTLKSGACSKCGKELQDDFAMCPYCGEKV